MRTLKSFFGCSWLDQGRMGLTGGGDGTDGCSGELLKRPWEGERQLALSLSCSVTAGRPEEFWGLVRIQRRIRGIHGYMPAVA